MNTEQELRPCPFCGGTNIALVNGGLGNRFAHCDGCRASTDDGSEERAIAAWNRRSSDEQAEVVAWRYRYDEIGEDNAVQWSNWILMDHEPTGLDRTFEIERLVVAPSPAVAAGGVTALLDAYEAQVKQLTPLGHENIQRGRSTYNWKMAVIAELRQLAALPTPPSRGEGE